MLVMLSPYFRLPLKKGDHCWFVSYFLLDQKMLLHMSHHCLRWNCPGLCLSDAESLWWVYAGPSQIPVFINTPRCKRTGIYSGGTVLSWGDMCEVVWGSVVPCFSARLRQVMDGRVDAWHEVESTSSQASIRVHSSPQAVTWTGDVHSYCSPGVWSLVARDLVGQ